MYPPVDETEQKNMIRRVYFETRVEQHKGSMLKKSEIDKLQLADSTKKTKHHEWCQNQRHSLYNKAPMWIASIIGMYDGSVHLPSNLLRALLFKLFEQAKMFDAVSSRPGSKVSRECACRCLVSPCVTGSSGTFERVSPETRAYDIRVPRVFPRTTVVLFFRDSKN